MYQIDRVFVETERGLEREGALAPRPHTTGKSDMSGDGRRQVD